MGSSSIILIFIYFSILGKPEYELMQTAWRERNQDARIKNAKEAIALNPECATAYILLAEEEAVDITGKKEQFKFLFKFHNHLGA